MYCTVILLYISVDCLCFTFFKYLFVYLFPLLSKHNSSEKGANEWNCHCLFLIYLYILNDFCICWETFQCCVTGESQRSLYIIWFFFLWLPVVIIYSVNKAFLIALLTAAPQLHVIHQRMMDYKNTHTNTWIYAKVQTLSLLLCKKRQRKD